MREFHFECRRSSTSTIAIARPASRAGSNIDYLGIPFGFAFPAPAPGRLGVNVQSITPELAEYFGAKNGGALVSSVIEGIGGGESGHQGG